MKFFRFVILTGIILFQFPAKAVLWEINLGYQYFQRTIDRENGIKNQSQTFNVTIYLGSFVALDLGYLRGLFESREFVSNPTPQRRLSQTFTQTGDVGLMFFYGTRLDPVSPFIKLGASYITRDLQIQIDNLTPLKVKPPDVITPSASAGLRISITQSFNLRLQVDVIQTPVPNQNPVIDIAARAGIGWIF